MEPILVLMTSNLARCCRAGCRTQSLPHTYDLRMTDRQAVQIQAGPAGSALTAQQTRFNTLVADVALWRAALADWNDRLARCDQAIEPVRRELHAAWRDWVFALDTASLQPGLARAERVQLSDWLREAATALLEVEEDDPAIASLLRRHGSVQDPQPVTGAHPAAREDEPPQDWEALAEAAAAQRAQRAASRRAAARRKRQAAAAREVSHSLRDVYRKLASALHPDREPDAQQRQRKTGLMQQANQAYADGNLLVLLELQIEAEQVDTAHLGNLDDRRLQHYISVLQDQLGELQAEVRRLEASFRAAVGAPAGSGLQARKADRLVSAEVQRLRSDLLLLRRQARVLLDVESTRDWLREQRRS